MKDETQDSAPVDTTDKTMASSNENDTSDTEKPIAASSAEEEYPQGLKLVVLSSATIIAVFLIALDQVCVCVPDHFLPNPPHTYIPTCPSRYPSQVSRFPSWYRELMGEWEKYRQ